VATWKVAHLTKTCALSGRPLPPGAPIIAALFGVEEEVSEDKVRGSGFVRKDFLVEGSDPAALEKAVEGSFCTWRTTTPPESGSKTPRLDLGMAKDLLERLVAAADPSRAAVAWTLAMLLIRKRHLHLVSEREGTLTLRWPKEEETFRVPTVVVTEAEEESLQQELLRLFEV
jgi:hypothetical protein